MNLTPVHVVEGAAAVLAGWVTAGSWSPHADTPCERRWPPARR